MDDRAGAGRRRTGLRQGLPGSPGARCRRPPLATGGLRCRGVVWALVVAGLVALAPLRADADDAVVGTRGEGIVPLQNDQVEMVAETVDIYPYFGIVYVEAVFTLRNTGAATELRIGFPEEEYQDEEERGGLRRLSIRDFVAEVDGVPTPTSYEAAAAPPGSLGSGEYRIAGWHTFRVSFAAGQTRVMRHTYLAVPSYSSNGASRFQYILHTGALWKGPIGWADIRVHPSGGFTIADLSLGLGSRDYAVEQGALVWHLRDVEPTAQDDTWVEIAPPGDRPLTEVSGADSTVSPGQKVSYRVQRVYPASPWPAGTDVALYGGAERRKLVETVCATPCSQVEGDFTVPAELTAHLGAAVEVWAELDQGRQRAMSTLLYLRKPPDRLPASGGSPLPALMVVAAGALLGAGLGIRWIADTSSGLSQ